MFLGLIFSPYQFLFKILFLNLIEFSEYNTVTFNCKIQIYPCLTQLYIYIYIYIFDTMLLNKIYRMLLKSSMLKKVFVDKISIGDE